MSLKPANRGEHRRQMSVSLDQPEDVRLWERVRARAQEWNVTVKSLVLTAMADYLAQNQEKPE